MKTAALVPFKRFTRAKGRLRNRYTDLQVEELGRAMLADVLTALAGATLVDVVLVLTDDPAVAEVAQAAGAEVRLRDPDPGLNPTLTFAEEELHEFGFDASLVVLGDLPLLQAADIDKVVSHAQEHSVVIVPSNDGGTALLLRRPPCAVPNRFEGKSAEAHAAAAREIGLEPLVLDQLGFEVSLDLDTPDDARRVLEGDRPCRTRRLLEEFGV